MSRRVAFVPVAAFVAIAAALSLGVPAPATAMPVARAATQATGATLHVAARVPVIGPRVELSALRPAARAGVAPPRRTASGSNPWTLLATISGAVIHDVSFPTAKVGYAAAELGQVWKTTDGGTTWNEVENVGFPYYWFGIHALDADNVAVSGFNDSTSEGVLRWSHDGGKTWSSDVVLTTTGWSYRNRFVRKDDGLVVDGLATQSANAAHYTTDGGAGASDWSAVVPDPSGGWFGNEFSLLPNRHARVAGITYCDSKNLGADWTCGPSVDSVFDGAVFFADDNNGWDGGGEISPSVAGWVHRTTDGGKTWSARTLNSSFPIRDLLFVTASNGWAAGGNIYSNAGGIYFSSDGGQTWSLDVDTNGHEMSSCDSRPAGRGHYRVWCVGYDASLNGAVYGLRY